MFVVLIAAGAVSVSSRLRLLDGESGGAVADEFGFCAVKRSLIECCFRFLSPEVEDMPTHAMLAGGQKDQIGPARVCETCGRWRRSRMTRLVQADLGVAAIAIDKGNDDAARFELGRTESRCELR